MKAAATLIFGNSWLMVMEKPTDESYMGSWPKSSNDVLETNSERSLEEELERIIKLADNISEKAESAAENLLDKRQKGKRNAKKSALTSLVFGRSRTSLRSDKSSLRQPRLSPLAARAALAATVTPLRGQAGLPGKAQALNLHSGADKAGKAGVTETCLPGMPQRLNLDPEDGKLGISSSKNKKKDNRGKNSQNTAAPGRKGYQAASARKKVAEQLVQKTTFLPPNQNDQDIQLIVDIPIYKENYIEKAVNLTIDAPFWGR